MFDQSSADELFASAFIEQELHADPFIWCLPEGVAGVSEESKEESTKDGSVSVVEVLFSADGQDFWPRE